MQWIATVFTGSRHCTMYSVQCTHVNFVLFFYYFYSSCQNGKSRYRHQIVRAQIFVPHRSPYFILFILQFYVIYFCCSFLFISWEKQLPCSLICDWLFLLPLISIAKVCFLRKTKNIEMNSETAFLCGSIAYRINLCANVNWQFDLMEMCECLLDTFTIWLRSPMWSNNQLFVCTA